MEHMQANGAKKQYHWSAYLLPMVNDDYKFIHLPTNQVLETMEDDRTESIYRPLRKVYTHLRSTSTKARVMEFNTILEVIESAFKEANSHINKYKKKLPMTPLQFWEKFLGPEVNEGTRRYILQVRTT